MATYIQRLKRKNSSGSYDTIHLETSAKAVLMDNGSSLSESGGGKVLYPIKDLVTGTIQSGSTVTISGMQWIVLGTNPLKGLAYFMLKNYSDTVSEDYGLKELNIATGLTRFTAKLTAKVKTALVPESLPDVDISPGLYGSGVGANQGIALAIGGPARINVFRYARLPRIAEIGMLQTDVAWEKSYWLEDIISDTLFDTSYTAHPYPSSIISRAYISTGGKINTTDDGSSAIRPVIALQIA